MRLLIAQERSPEQSESFVNAQARHLPGDKHIVHGLLPVLDGQPVLTGSVGTVLRLTRHWLRGVRPQKGWDAWAITCGYVDAIRRTRPDVVLAQFGTVAGRILEACQITGVPLVAHFHGQDAYRHDILDAQDRYRDLFQHATAIIAVSNAMATQLQALGASPHKISTIPYGIDCQRFQPGAGERNAKQLIAVGRFVEKKAPHLTLFAFRELLQSQPAAHLTLVGTGPLLGVARDLVDYLNIGPQVTFRGELGHEQIVHEMCHSGCFVQHSRVADDGDSEGTPLAVLEAQACGIPVVSTQHAGIRDAVVEGQTGFLVDEGDWQAMAEKMKTVVADPELARKLGDEGREHVLKNYNLDQQIPKLHAAIQNILT